MEIYEDFIYTQKDLPNNCYEIFEDMRQKKEFCDVTFRIGNKSIHAHRVILAATIPYFRSLFSSDTRGNPNNDTFLQDVSPSALEVLIDFSYKGKLKITMKNSGLLLSAACFLQVDQVRTACIEFIIKRISAKDIFCFRQIGCSLGCTDLVNRLDDSVAKHFEEVTQSQDFFDLPYSYVKDLVSRDDICVINEETVFEAIMKWVKVSPHHSDADIPELLSCVRMSFLKLDYLKDTVATHELLKNSVACRDIIDDARDYHLFPERRHAKNSWKFSISPRCYKRTAVGSKITFESRQQKKTVPVSLFRRITEEVAKNSEGASELRQQDKKSLTKISTYECSMLDACKFSGGNLQPHMDESFVQQSSHSDPLDTKRSKIKPPVTSAGDAMKKLPRKLGELRRHLEELRRNSGKLHKACVTMTESAASRSRLNVEAPTIEEFLLRRREDWKEKKC